MNKWTNICVIFILSIVFFSLFHTAFIQKDFNQFIYIFGCNGGMFILFIYYYAKLRKTKELEEDLMKLREMIDCLGDVDKIVKEFEQYYELIQEVDDIDALLEEVRSRKQESENE